MERKTIIIISIIVVMVIIMIIVGIVLFSRSPTSGTSAGGTPASGTPASGTPASGTPASGTPASGTPSSDTSGPPTKFRQFTQWACFPDVLTPVNVNEDGNIQCFSYDGVNCHWVSDKSTCDRISSTVNNLPPAPQNTTLNPLACTVDQYNNPKHWCNLSNKYFTPVN